MKKMERKAKMPPLILIIISAVGLFILAGYIIYSIYMARKIGLYPVYTKSIITSFFAGKEGYSFEYKYKVDSNIYTGISSYHPRIDNLEKGDTCIISIM